MVFKRDKSIYEVFLKYFATDEDTIQPYLAEKEKSAFKY